MQKVALVTGGAYGIGRAIVEDLARDHRVVFSWHGTSPEPLLAAHPGLHAVRCDLTQEGAAGILVTETLDRSGRLDVIVNNAGRVAQTSKDNFDRAANLAVLELNFLAPAAILAAALPHLHPGASIVSVSSVNAVLPPRDAATYGASKAALNLWTRAMAKELGPTGIRVNAVAPGAINVPEAPRPDDLTAQFVDMTALGRIGRPEDVARAVRFLASEDAAFITGEILTVSGGYRL
ncbi:SDR family NAD(P)-dependent oxidoreductase [Roseobacteraceae bacterium NS-SX3]